jgi:DNA excision repair protein ERCC-1
MSSGNSSTNRFASNPSGAPLQSRPINHAGLDRPTDSSTSTAPKSGVVQPKPQALPRRTGPSSIIVSTRQKGNPILTNIKNMPWEYGDILADYQIGQTACALFLSLKYHRLHPEYIYSRIKGLQGKYNLRIILTLVDIDNHEASLKELSKTSVINNVTVILCWSAAEGARYLELFKSNENASSASIRQHQSDLYADRMVDFVTTPRAINKTDAVSLVSQFGTIRTAVNARHEDVATIAGWGEKKVQQWCQSVQEPFRVVRAGKRGIDLERLNFVSTQPISRQPTLSRDVTQADTGESTNAGGNVTNVDLSKPSDISQRPHTKLGPFSEETWSDDEDVATEMNVVQVKPIENPAGPAQLETSNKRKPADDPLSEGVMAALGKLRKAS